MENLRGGMSVLAVALGADRKEIPMNSSMALWIERNRIAFRSTRDCSEDDSGGLGAKSLFCAVLRLDLYHYFPFLAIGVQFLFCILAVAQYARSRVWMSQSTGRGKLGEMHRKAKFLCVVLLLMQIIRGSLQLSKPLSILMHAGGALEWLTISIAMHREEIECRSIFPAILRGWWVVTAVLSIVELGAAVMTGSVVSASAAVNLVTFMCSLLLAIGGFTGHVYRQNSGHPTGMDPTKVALLNEASAQAVPAPVECGFSRAGLLSVCTFSWLNSLLSVGHEKPLTMQDIPLIDTVDDATRSFEVLRETWELEKLEKVAAGELPSLPWALFKAFWRPFFFAMILALVWTFAMFVGPVLQNLLISFMEQKNRSFSRGFILVLVLLTGKLLETLSSHQLLFRVRRLGLRMWIGVGCAVYNKSLRLSLKAKQARSVGEITNLMSADVQRLLELVYYLAQGLVLPLQIVIAMIILFKVVGVAMVAGLSTLTVVLITNSYIIRGMRTYRAEVLVCKDKRMRATTECLANMKVIKLQAWDDMFKQRIEDLRAEEQNWIEKFMFIWANAIHMVWTGPLAVSGVTFLTMVLMGKPLSTAQVFTAITTFRIIQEPIRFLPDIMANLVQAMVSLQRVGTFLMEEEVDESAVERFPDGDRRPYAIEIDSASYAWDKLEAKVALKDINLKVGKGTCVAICGGVGSGKSSLLHCIIGELPKLSGTARVSGRVAYVAQSAWIQTKTIRDNILFGRPMQTGRYKEVVRVSGLEADLAQFPEGDETEIGERGTTLSGGQKQRVQLARALYQDADIYLLDDPFSAVDAHTGTFLFEKYARGALKSKTVILVTHQVEFLPAVDQIIVMRAPGEIVQKGTYRELVHQGKDFGAFVEALQESLENVNKATTHTRSEDEDKETSEWSATSSIEENVASQISSSGSSRSGSLSKSSSMKKPSSLSKSTSMTSNNEIADSSIPTKEKLILEEERATGTVDIRLWLAYVTRIWKGLLYIIVFFPQISTVSFQLSSDAWLASGTSSSNIASLKFIGIYILLLAGCSLSVLLRTKLVAYWGVRTAQAFFTAMLNSVIRAPMSFIDSTPVGRILSRSSTDQTTLDLELPMMVASVFNAVVQLTGVVLLTVYVTPPVIFLIVPVAVIYVRLQRYYIASSRELSRLTALTEGPMFLNISESVAGTSTIRAFQELARFEGTNTQRLEAYQRTYFHNLTATEWLGLRLDSLAATILSATACLLLTLPENTIAPGLAAMSLSYGLSLSGVMMRLVLSASLAENKMISVERIRQYSDIPGEAPTFIPGKRLPSGWPITGRLELQNLQIRYRPSSPLVLKGLSCVVQPREKVGIVGRTGSGKSTLIQALFRLVEPAGGRILIDDVDITTIGLNDLRSALGVIPQEPTLFEGTIRTNLDPFNLCSDREVWESLDKCQLGQVVRDKPQKLDSSVSEQGQNWSVGERQLLCLGRALLKHARILVLDEATASVDITTDALIQATIKQYLADCTILSVAHRIPTVMDSDRVLVLDNGHLMENDSPAHLMTNESSMFSKLVREYTQRTPADGFSNLDEATYFSLP